MLTPEQIAGESEHSHQAALFAWAALNVKQYPQLKWLYAVPNGFYSTSGQKAKMKAEGLRDGVPDVFLPVPKLSATVNIKEILWCGLYIEMKREKYRNAKDGGCSPEQLEWREHLLYSGYSWCVAYNWEEARNYILEYLK